MRLENFILGILIFSAFMVMGPLIISDININYGKNISTDEFNETYDAVDRLYGTSKDIRNETMNLDVPEDSSWEGMTKGGFGAIRKIDSYYEVFNSMINELAKTLQIPTFFVYTMFIAISIIISFSIIYLVMRYKP